MDKELQSLMLKAEREAFQKHEAERRVAREAADFFLTELEPVIQATREYFESHKKAVIIKFDLTSSTEREFCLVANAGRENVESPHCTVRYLSRDQIDIENDGMPVVNIMGNRDKNHQQTFKFILAGMYRDLLAHFPHTKNPEADAA